MFGVAPAYENTPAPGHDTVSTDPSANDSMSISESSPSPRTATILRAGRTTMASVASMIPLNWDEHASAGSTHTMVTRDAVFARKIASLAAPFAPPIT